MLPPQMTEKTFFDLDKKYSTLKNSKVVIVPFGLEKIACYCPGSHQGPQAIFKASQQVELWDEEFGKSPYKIGIASLNFFKIKKNHAQALEQLEKIVDEIFGFKKFPVILGGDHSITIGGIKAAIKHCPKLTILQFDAHSDTRDQWLGSRLSQAAVMRRCLEINKNINLVQLGIRNVAEEELSYRQKEKKRIKTFWVKDKENWKIKEILKSCKNNVYLTFDTDVLDSGIMPATCAPEPGGLDWYETLAILKTVCRAKKIIGADFVELTPIKGLVAPDFLVAKLIYKFLGYNFCNVDKK